MLLLALLLAFTAHAQVTVSLAGPATARQGSAVTLALASGGATANGPAALQWTVVPPSGFTIPAATIGTQGAASTKTLACGTDKTLCVLYGVNQNVIANGQIATLSVAIPANATPGPASFGLSGLVTTDKNGFAMTTTPGPFYSIVVTARADLNSDGVVNSTDVSLMAGQVTAGTCSDDQNADGKCDIIDVMLVVLKALGF